VTPRAAFVVLLVIAGCARGDAFHGGRTSLALQERPLLAKAAMSDGNAFRRIWKRPSVAASGLLKWAEDHSWAIETAPPDLLQSIRDGIGGLNQSTRTGSPVLVAVTVYGFHRSWWGKPEASYEIVGRDSTGQLLWAADDAVEARPELAITLADTEVTLLSRAVVSKVRKEFGL
jgi:hypothetical protein